MKTYVRLAATAVMIALPTLAMADDMTMNAAATSSPADKAFDDSMQTMMKAMAAKPTGNPDKDFVMMMMPHHQGAIDMAKVELQYGTDPMLRKMATDIIKAQEKEIAAMKAWQAKHGQ